MNPQPPKRALQFLRWFCREDYLEEFEGDLIELFEKHSIDSHSQARRKFTWNVLKSFRPSNIKRFKGYHSLNYLDMYKNSFRLAFRHFNKSRINSLINLTGLTLGLCACIVIYFITSYELSYDTFHPDKEKIYRVVGTVNNEDVAGFVPYALPKALREEVSGLEAVAAFHNFETNVKVPNGVELKVFNGRRNPSIAELVFAEPEYFDVFQYDWLAGNAKTALNAPYQVVLSENKAHYYFGNVSPSEAIGKELIYRDSLRVTVSGIVKDWQENTDFTFTDFVSFSTISSSPFLSYINLNEWDDIWSASQAFVKLSDNVSPEQIEQQFPAFSGAHFKNNFQFTPHLQHLSELHFDTNYRDNYSRKAHKPTIYGLIGVAVFILIIAVVNFVNLSTAQAFKRAKEAGIRKVLGAQRKGIIFQSLLETSLLTFLAASLSLLFVPSAFHYFKWIIPQGVSLIIDQNTIIFLLAIILVTTLLAGVYPALIISNYSPSLVIKGQLLNKNNGKAYVRKGLMIFQFAISMVFILGTLLVTQQINFMRNKDLGFKSEAVITISPPRGAKTDLIVLYSKIEQLPGVEDITRELSEPMGSNFGMDKLTYQNKNGEENEFDAAYKMGDDNFVPFYQMKLLAGRNMLKSDTPKEFVITESLAQVMGFDDPAQAIGEILQWRANPYPVVGVIADFHQLSMHEKMPPTFITITSRPREIAVKLTTTDIAGTQATLNQIEKAWAEVYPDAPFEYRFLDDTIASFYDKELKTSELVNMATFIAILICCLGLYGLSAFTAAQRTKEIGIRKVLGASVASIMRLLSGEFAPLVLIASIISFPVAWYFMSQWLQGFEYHVEIKWWLFVLAVGMVLMAAILTASYQSLKVAKVNPAESLKTE